MKQPILYAAALLAACTISCSDDNDATKDLPPDELACKVTKLAYSSYYEERWTWSNDQLTNIAYFDSNVEEDSYEIQYTDGKPTKILEYESGDLESTHVLEYNNAGQYSKVTETEDGMVTVTTVSYNASGLRTKVEIVYTIEGEDESSEIEEYTYENGNLKQMDRTETYDGVVQTISVTTYEYSDKVNTLAAIEDLVNIVYNSMGPTPSKNFLVKSEQVATRFLPGLEPRETTTTTTKEYTFAEDGLLTRVITTWDYSEDDSNDVDDISFTYNCN